MQEISEKGTQPQRRGKLPERNLIAALRETSGKKPVRGVTDNSQVGVKK